MPYKVRRRGEGWVLLHEKNNKWSVKSHHESKKDAESAMRLLYGVENGMKQKRCILAELESVDKTLSDLNGSINPLEQLENNIDDMK